MLENSQRVHFVGIGGIGMSGIAELLVNLGYDVRGSDLASSPVTERLERLGVRFTEGHDARHVDDAQLVVVSTAIPAHNPERRAAAERGIPVMSRGAMLAELTSMRRAVAVVGSHGKTTTSSMVAVVLDAAGLDPTAIIGGRVSTFGSNARVGQGAFMVVEADESDRSFLKLSPEIAVLTNIDDEHLEAYDGMADLEASFLQFARRAAEHGTVVAGVDDPRLRRMVPMMAGRVITYALDDPAADVRAEEVTLGPAGSQMRVVVQTRSQRSSFEATVAAPGRHNVQNALATMAVAHALSVPTDAVVSALAGFTGADRRFQVRGIVGGVVVIDDYAHHPTEIEAVLSTARLRAPRRLRVVFQPHRYTRTLRLRDRFAQVLAAADELVLTDVYAASEAPIAGATTAALADAIKKLCAIPVRVVSSLDDAVEAVTADARSGDLIVTLGAGSIGQVPSRVVDALRERAGGGPS